MNSSSDKTKEESYVKNQQEEQQFQLLETLRLTIYVVLLAIYFLTSVLCNSVALVVLFQKTFVKNAYALGQRVLAFMNLALAFTMVLGKGKAQHDMYKWDDALCRAYSTISFILCTNANWTVVYLTVIRYACLKSPLQVNSAAFVRNCHWIIMIMSILISCYYVSIYHELTRYFGVERSIHFFDECFSFTHFVINEYVYRSLLVLPEYILPAVAVLVFNILIYIEYENVAARRQLLKQEVEKRSKNVTKIKGVIHRPSTDTIRTILSDSGLSMLESPPLPSGKDLRNISSSLPHPALPKKSTSFSFLLRWKASLRSAENCSIDAPVHVDPRHVEGSDTDRYHSLRVQLHREKMQLRRATCAYALLNDLQATPSFQSRRESRKSASQSKVSEVTGTSGRPQGHGHRSYSVSVRSDFRSWVVLYVAFFWLFHAPHCLWYMTITTEEKDFQLSTIEGHQGFLQTDIALFMNLYGYLLNSLLYINAHSRFREGLASAFRKCKLRCKRRTL